MPITPAGVGKSVAKKMMGANAGNGAEATSSVAQKGLSGLQKKVVAGVACAGIVSGFFAGGNEKPTTTIESAGKGHIQSLTLEPGKFCNAKAEVPVKDITTRYTHFIGKVVFGKHIGVNAWVQETMQGTIEAQVCIWTHHKKTAQRVGDHYNLQLTASSDPEKSDFTLITYPQNPVEMKYTPDSSNVQKFDNATLGNLKTDLNLIPGVNLHGQETKKDKLKAIDLLEGYNYVSRACGSEVVKRLTAPNIKGGNMIERMNEAMIKDTPGALGKVNPTDINILPVHIDGTGLSNQYSTPVGKGKDAVSVLEKVEKESNGLTFPKLKDMDPCTDAAKEIVNAS